MLASDIITLSREQINDTIKPYRFDDTEMLRAVDASCKELQLDRPSFLLKDDNTYTTLLDITAVGDTILFSESYLMALAHKVTYKVLLKDSDDDYNAKLATTHLSLYNTSI